MSHLFLTFVPFLVKGSARVRVAGSLVGETASEGFEQRQRTFDSDFSAYYRPDNVGVLGEEFEPRFGVGGHKQVSVSDKTIFHHECFVSDVDGCFFAFLTCEAKVVGCIDV